MIATKIEHMIVSLTVLLIFSRANDLSCYLYHTKTMQELEKNLLFVNDLFFLQSIYQ